MHYVCLQLNYIASYCVWLSNQWKCEFADPLGQAQALAKPLYYFSGKMLNDADLTVFNLTLVCDQILACFSTCHATNPLLGGLFLLCRIPHVFAQARNAWNRQRCVALCPVTTMASVQFRMASIIAGKKLRSAGLAFL